MAHSSPPVALRVLRPFATERELLEAEASAFTRTGVVLIGAQSRPNGVVLRFEIALKDGTPVMRGEGRVVGFRAGTPNEEAALMLRFTRLDVKSKTLLDRAVVMREEKRSMAPARHPTPSPSRPNTPPPPPQPRPSGTPPPLPVTARSSGMPRPPTRPPGLPSVRPSLPSAAPFAAAPPPPLMPNLPEPEDDLDDAEEVDDGEIEAHELSNAGLDDLTVQQPPVAASEAQGHEQDDQDEQDDHDIAPVDLEGLDGPDGLDAEGGVGESRDLGDPQGMLDDLDAAHPAAESLSEPSSLPGIEPVSEPIPLLARSEAPAPIVLPVELAAPPIASPAPPIVAPVAPVSVRPVQRAEAGPMIIDADSRSQALERLRARARKIVESERESEKAPPVVDPSLTPVLGSLTQLRK